jgi:polysaccharide biosynthesis protein PslH
MKILIISPKIPYPPTDGGRRGIFGIIKYLKLRGHHIDVLAYRQNEELSQSKGLEKYARLFIVDVETRNTIGGVIKNLFSSVPYNLWKYQRAELKSALENYFEQNSPDIIQVTNAHMGWVIEELRRHSSASLILKEENLEMLIMRRFYQTRKNPLVKLYSFVQYKKFVKYEPALCEKFDLCVFVSGEDAKEIQRMNPKVKAAVIPAGVESDLLRSEIVTKEPYSLAHIGSLNWFPNYDGIQWFVDEVFPLVLKKYPQTKLYLYGGGIPRNFILNLSIKSNVVIMGFVDNIWQSISNKLLSIVPLRIGGGIRVKILEMLAAGQNIISTSLGAEGIPVEDGKNIILADTPNEFADRINKFFNCEFDMQEMRLNGKEMIRKHYTWERIAEMFELEYKKLTGEN